MKDNNEQLKIGDKVKCLHMGSVYVGSIVGVSSIFIGTAKHIIVDVGVSGFRLPIVINTTLFPENVKRVKA